MPTVTIAGTERDRAAVFAIRGAVFIAEQNVPIELEWDDADQYADHFLVWLDGVPAGAGRLVVRGDRGARNPPSPGTGPPERELPPAFHGVSRAGHLGRLAVLPHARGMGLGAMLVRAIEARARERGLVTVELHAQTHALRFYQRLGYTAYGPEFEDAGIPHRHMRRDLDAG